MPYEDIVPHSFFPEKNEEHLFDTLKCKNPTVDVMEMKSIAGWTLGKHFKNVTHIVDVANFGGPTTEYQVCLDPNKSATG